jgi:ComF family protein
MSFFSKIKKFFKKHIAYEKWTCNACLKENFNGKFVCDDCLEKLKVIGAKSCAHCGRELLNSQNYCTTCKDKLLSTTMGKSVFTYQDTAGALIRRFKYNGAKYMADYFAKEMSNLYFKYYFNTDYLTFVPMTKRAFYKRGYNQSELLAIALSKIVNVQVLGVLEKQKNTKRQAKLNRKERIKNLEHAFKVVDKKLVKGKSFTLVDDVTTTGSTIEVIAKLLLKHGAKEVKYLTVASVPPSCGY